VTGWLAERYGAKPVLAAGVAIWSLATLLTGFAGSFAALLVFRLLLGVGESVGFPCASKVLAGAVPVDRLGVANGVMSFGYLLGPAFGTLLGGYLMAEFGWRPVFILFGVLSLAWLWPWSRATVDAPRAVVEPAAGPAPSLRTILRQRALWGASLGHFASNYTYYFILAWLPFYLVKARGFSMESMALIASWAYLLTAGCALATGAWTDRRIRAGGDTTRIYKSIMGSCHVVALGCMVAMVTLPELGCVLALFLYSIMNGCASPGVYAIPQIVAGPRASGSWVGIQNCAGNVAGLVAPVMTGVLVDRTGNFEIAFGLAAVVNVLGFVGWVLLLPAVRPLLWPREPA
jgi:MFS family permease